ncbi:MAG: ubiquinol oxidase subunit II [Pseudomonadota bacterium]
MVKKYIVNSLLILICLFVLGGCDLVVMNPSGDVARQQASLIWIATGLMLIVVIPVFILVGLFAWKYRASNKGADYDPNWHHSTTVEIVMWTIPLIIIMILSGITFVATHRLDPYTPLSRISPDQPVPSERDPLVIEVVAMKWKWLFFYPEQGVATVNELAAPVDREIQFKITSDALMNSFFIPALAGQIYAMSGMETQLHAVINEPGVYDGFSSNYSGHGFSHMKFKFLGFDDSGFDTWVNKVRTTGSRIDEPVYLALEEPSTDHPVVYYSAVSDKLYHNILNRCVAGRGTCINEYMGHSKSKHAEH